jgi:hypothetical protein
LTTRHIITPADLLRRIESLPRDTPRHKELEQALQIGAGFGRGVVWLTKEALAALAGGNPAPGLFSEHLIMLHGRFQKKPGASVFRP